MRCPICRVLAMSGDDQFYSGTCSKECARTFQLKEAVSGVAVMIDYIHVTMLANRADEMIGGK